MRARARFAAVMLLVMVLAPANAADDPLMLSVSSSVRNVTVKAMTRLQLGSSCFRRARRRALGAAMIAGVLEFAPIVGRVIGQFPPCCLPRPTRSP